MFCIFCVFIFLYLVFCVMISLYFCVFVFQHILITWLLPSMSKWVKLMVILYVLYLLCFYLFVFGVLCYDIFVFLCICVPAYSYHLVVALDVKVGEVDGDPPLGRRDDLPDAVLVAANFQSGQTTTSKCKRNGKSMK